MAALKSVLLQLFPRILRPIIGNTLIIPETKNANAKCNVHLKVAHLHVVILQMTQTSL